MRSKSGAASFLMVHTTRWLQKPLAFQTSITLYKAHLLYWSSPWSLGDHFQVCSVLIQGGEGFVWVTKVKCNEKSRLRSKAKSLNDDRLCSASFMKIFPIPVYLSRLLLSRVSFSVYLVKSKLTTLAISTTLYQTQVLQYFWGGWKKQKEANQAKDGLSQKQAAMSLLRKYPQAH
jgi:hypothetical protein